jgi:transketolase
MSATQILANRIRQNGLKMVHRAKASHIASALSIMDILAVLYGQVMHFDPDDQDCVLRDRFILIKGHACVAVYATLAEVGLITQEQNTRTEGNLSRISQVIEPFDAVCI